MSEGLTNKGKKIEKMRCLVCDKDDMWRGCDAMRNVPKDMVICRECGFVTYHTEYGQSPRAPMTINDLYTGERKIHYHAAFLGETLTQWKKEDRKNLSFYDVGAAGGMLLSWVKNVFFHGKKDVACGGVEIDQNRISNAFYNHQLRLTSYFDETLKHDMIFSYKCAEHIRDIDKELLKYKEALKDDGLLYISVPVWFDEMSSFGVGVRFDIEYYYDTNHVNTWTEELWEEVLRKTGFEIVKKNRTIYDNTYLCKRNDEVMKQPAFRHKYEKIVERMIKIKKASEAYNAKDFRTALAFWPNYPICWQGYYEMTRKEAHGEKGNFADIKKEHIDKAIEACPNSSDTRRFAADLCMRYEEFDLALQYLNESSQMTPGQPPALLMAMHCFINIAERQQDIVERQKYFEEARKLSLHIQEISQQCRPEAITWLFNINARMALPFDPRAKEK